MWKVRKVGVGSLGISQIFANLVYSCQNKVHKNNFDFLRLLFAAFVVITHSYALSYSLADFNEGDWLFQLSNHQAKLSDLGVKGFFIISGFLIFQSLIRSKSLTDYYWKRILRLFPALTIVLLLTVLLAPFVYEHPSIPYLQNTEVWSYFPNNLSLFKRQLDIAGVFDSNPRIRDINGALWTLQYEFIFYMLLSVLFVVRNRKTFLKIFLTASYLFLLIGNVFFYDQLCVYGYSPFGRTNYLLDLGVFFFAGSLLAVFEVDKVKWPVYVPLFLFALLVLSLGFHFFKPLWYVLFPLVVISIGLRATPYVSDIAKKIGDASYGVYIYSFPMQQALVHFFKLDFWPLVVSSLSLSLIIGFLSWHFIEKRALAYKSLTSKKTVAK